MLLLCYSKILGKLIQLINTPSFQRHSIEIYQYPEKGAKTFVFGNFDEKDALKLMLNETNVLDQDCWTNVIKLRAD